MKRYDIMVIGGIAAGMSAASQARRASSGLSIGVFEKSGFVSYGACGMPYLIGGSIPSHEDLIAINVEEYRNKRHIDIFTGAEATKVDFDRKLVSIAGAAAGEYSYGKLAIATGARAVVPPIPGIANEGVFTLRSLEDGIAIRRFVNERCPARGILIGGGFIGLEMAEALRARGIECTMLERMESVAMTLDPEIRKMIAAKLAENGVALHTGVGIASIERRGDMLVVAYGGGGVAEADFIVISTGVAPNTDFLRNTGLSMTDRGAIIVDDRSRTNLPDVYAAGDCCMARHLVTGESVYMPLGTTANKQGRVAGLQAAGVSGETFPGIVGSQLVKVFDLEIGRTGVDAGEAERAGIDAESTSASWHNAAGYFPGVQPLFVTLTVDRNSGALIGGQVAGPSGAALRVNILAAAVTSRMNINDFAYLDLGYAPPFAPVWDALLVAAQKLVKRG